MGALIQNYILAAVRLVSFSLSSAATGLAAEIAIAPLIVVVLGVDGWSWLRPAVGATMLATAAFLTVVARIEASRLMERWLGPGRRATALRGGLARFLPGLSRFDDPRFLRVTALITAAYVLLEGAGRRVVAPGVGAQVTIHPALATYPIGVTLALVVPAFTDLGTLEAGSVAGLVAMGSSPQVAVAVSLLDRG